MFDLVCLIGISQMNQNVRSQVLNQLDFHYRDIKVTQRFFIFSANDN